MWLFTDRQEDTEITNPTKSKPLQNHDTTQSSNKTSQKLIVAKEVVLTKAPALMPSH